MYSPDSTACPKPTPHLEASQASCDPLAALMQGITTRASFAEVSVNSAGEARSTVQSFACSAKMGSGAASKVAPHTACLHD